MSRFQFELAGPNDDADLRHVLAATPMEGSVEVSFRREPSWFGAAVVDGRLRQVVACRDTETGRIIGFGCRSLRDVFVNGAPAVVGYLSSLRVLKEYRNIGLVARGYAFFRRLHVEPEAQARECVESLACASGSRGVIYVTTIAEANETALRVLTSGRAGLPTYHPAGKYITLVLRRVRPTTPPPGVTLRAACDADLPALLEFLTTVGSRRQFFPHYRRDDFLDECGLLRGLALADVILAERGGRILGTIAGWDQFAYRQSVVHAYHGPLRWTRRLLNLCGARLPAPGEPFRYLTAALPVVAEDDPVVFAALLAQLHRHARGGPWSHVLLGLHDSDPLLTVAEKFAFTRYTTNLYLVCWQDGEAMRASLDGRPPYLELGSL